MAIPGHLEAAFGADRTADPLSWTWTDLTDRTQDNEVTIARGKRSAGAAQVEPGSMTIALGNGDGALTPRKAGTTPSYYPNVRRGTPVRHYVNTGARYLALTGAASSNATTPDAVSWNIGADLAVAVQFRSPMRVPPVGSVGYEVVGQFTVSGSQRSWVLYLSSDGFARLRFSTDGAAEINALTSFAIPRPDAGPLTVALELDGDNGASGNTTTWYVAKGTIATLVANKTAYAFGSVYTNSGTASLFNSTGTVGIGDVPGSGFSPYPGGIDAVLIRAGTLTTGTLVANPDFTTQTVGAGSFADTATSPKTWTINSPAAITDRKVTLLGTLDANEGDYPAQSVTGTARRTWTIAGPLRRMRQGEPPLQSALFRRIMAPVTDTTVHDYFPLEDGSDATGAYSPITGTSTGIVAMNLASDDSLDASAPLPSMTGNQPFGWDIPLTGNAPASGWEVSFPLYIGSVETSPAFTDLMRIDTLGGTTSQWVIRVDSANFRLFAKDLDGANVLSATQAFNTDVVGKWLTVMITVAQNGANIDYDLDFIVIGPGTTYGLSGTLNTFNLGSAVRLRNLVAEAPDEGISVGHFTVTSGAVPGWLAPADTAYAGEPATARVFRLCREQRVPILVDGPHAVGVASGWPASITAGAQPMGPQRYGVSLLGYLNECAVVDNGILGETRELLGLTFRSGATMPNQTARLSMTSEVTSPLTPTDDDRDLVNKATVTRVNGSSATFTDDGSVTDEGLYEDSRTIAAKTDADVAGHAAWWVHEATWPEERFDKIPFELAKNTAKIDDWHSLSAGDVLEATALPSAQPVASLSQIADGWSQTISPHLWSVEANTRPAGPWNVGTVDDNPASPSTALARVDSSGTTLTGSLSNSATGGQSVTITGTLWTTAAGYFPLKVRIDEEVITLSGISGGASPQTFTISARGVDGSTAAAHSAGAEIHPALPVRVAPSRSFP